MGGKGVPSGSLASQQFALAGSVEIDSPSSGKNLMSRRRRRRADGARGSLLALPPCPAHAGRTSLLYAIRDGLPALGLSLGFDVAPLTSWVF